MESGSGLNKAMEGGEMPTSYDIPGLEWDEENDLKNFRVWIVDFVHGQPFTPLMLREFVTLNAFHLWATDELSLPTSKGLLWKVVDGWARFTPVVPAKDEIPERTRIYKEKMPPLMENHEKLWARDKDAMMEPYRPFLEAEFEKVSDGEAWRLFNDSFHIFEKQAWPHIYWFWFYCQFYNEFRNACREMLGISEHDPLFKKLLAGFDNKLFEVDRGLWGLADRARELKLDNTFLTIEDGDQVISALEESDAGKKWLEEFRKFLKVYGWRCVSVNDFETPTWVEKPSLAIPRVKGHLQSKSSVFAPDEERKHLAKEREEAEREILARVPLERREWFGLLMKLGQAAGVWSEEHAYYLDMFGWAIVHHAVEEAGRRLARAGVIDEPHDIYFLLKEEARWPIIAGGTINLRRQVNRRKEEYQRNIKNVPDLFHGDLSALPEVTSTNPGLSLFTPYPIVKPELKADLYGTVSTPGVAEGIARLIPPGIEGEKELAKIEPGEILVAPGTNPSMTPVFGIIAGAVTDGGGAMAHAAIVSREYGIPSVVGTIEATSKIKTGQRIRVDGDNCAVYILDK